MNLQNCNTCQITSPLDSKSTRFKSTTRHHSITDHSTSAPSTAALDCISFQTTPVRFEPPLESKPRRAAATTDQPSIPDQSTSDRITPEHLSIASHARTASVQLRALLGPVQTAARLASTSFHIRTLHVIPRFPRRNSTRHITPRRQIKSEQRGTRHHTPRLGFTASHGKALQPTLPFPAPRLQDIPVRITPRFQTTSIASHCASRFHDATLQSQVRSDHTSIPLLARTFHSKSVHTRPVLAFHSRSVISKIYFPSPSPRSPA